MHVCVRAEVDNRVCCVLPCVCARVRVSLFVFCAWRFVCLRACGACLRPIIVPNVVMKPGGQSYDLNSWQRPPGAPPAAFGSELQLEGYGRTGNLYLAKLRASGPVVPLHGVGGAVLLVSAELHRCVLAGVLAVGASE